MTQTTPPTRLSQLLKDVPAGELCQVLATFKEAIKTGTVMGVPADGETFTLRIQQLSGRVIRQTVTDEFVMDDEGFQTWLAGARKSSRYTVMAALGKIATTDTKLTDGTDDFAELARLRREALKKGGKTQPTQATASKEVTNPAMTLMRYYSKTPARPAKSKTVEAENRSPAAQNVDEERSDAATD